MYALLLLAQLGAPADDWIHITEVQVEPASVVRLPATQRLELDTCREALFESTGLDVVTESSFTAIVMAVVDRSGRVQRFRIARKPSIPVDASKPIRKALEEWRYNVAAASHSGEAFEVAISLPKPLGATKTSVCPKR